MPQSGRRRPRTKAPTPKGATARTARKPGRRAPSGTTGRVTTKGSGRYTPPIPKEHKVSPRWVPVLMFTLLAVGMLVIVGNYMGLVPGGETQNVYLFVGLGLITGGFITATRYR